MYSWNAAAPIPSVDAWGEAFTGFHGASRISVPDPTVPWAGSLDWQRSATYAMALCRGGQELVRRERRHIRSDPRGNLRAVGAAGRHGVGGAGAVVG